MLLQVGGYRHASHECAVTRSFTRELGPGGDTLTVRRQWQITGTLQAADHVSLQAAKNVLEAAYAVPYPDVYLWHESGLLHDSILNAGSTSGVIITSGPDYPNGTGAEGGTFLTFSASVMASYEAAVANTDLLESFTEAVSTVGTGGRRFIVVETVDDECVPQILNRKTKCRATQSGTAVGRYGYPPVPPPLWPEWELEDQRTVTPTAPRREGRTLAGYAVSWSYSYESPAPLRGLPNVWVF